MIYNCLYLANNCEECALYGHPYNCAWCIPTETCVNGNQCTGMTDSYGGELIRGEWQVENCPNKINISSPEWCEHPFTAIESECFYISNNIDEMEGDYYYSIDEMEGDTPT